MTSPDFESANVHADELAALGGPDIDQLLAERARG